MFAYGALHRDMIFMGYAHHLGYNLLQFLAAQAGQQFDPPLSPIYILQYLSMAAGLAGGYVFYRLLLRMRVRPPTATVLTGILLFCYAYWYYARQADAHIIAGFLLICFLSSMQRLLQSPSGTGIARSAFILAIATIMHQSTILLLPAVLLAFLACESTRRNLAKNLGIFAFIYGSVGILPYLVAGWHMVGARSISDFHMWLTETNQWGNWGLWRAETLPATAVGIVRSFVGSHHLLGFGPVTAVAMRLFPAGSFQDEFAIARTVPSWLVPVLILVEAAVVLAALAVLVRSVRRVKEVTLSGGRALMLMLATWILIFGIFFAWWAPERVEFWISWFVPVLAWVGLASSGGEPRGRGSSWAGYALLGGLVFVNFFGSIYPQSGPVVEKDTSVSVAIDATAATGDIVMSDCTFGGRASRFSRSFRRVNLLDPIGKHVRAGLGQTIYHYGDMREDGGDPVPDGEYDVFLPALTRSSIALVDSLLGEAGRSGNRVYLIATPLQTDRALNSVYGHVVESLGKEFDISESMRIRSDVDIRIVKRRASDLR
jgi:hypothetical protein